MGTVNKNNSKKVKRIDCKKIFVMVYGENNMDTIHILNIMGACFIKSYETNTIFDMIGNTHKLILWQLLPYFFFMLIERSRFDKYIEVLVLYD